MTPAPTTSEMWRTLLEIALTRQTVAYDLVCETLEEHGPTHQLTAIAYAHWMYACDRHRHEEQQYQLWLKSKQCLISSKGDIQ